ncbi:hypothetical protein CR513_23894, partial [Mucuna pruriens]
MLVTRNQASSTNEGEEDTLQRLLKVVASLQARSDEQSRLNAKVEQRQDEAEERHRQAEEHHLEAMRMAEQREEESYKSEEIDGTPIPPNFREIVVEPFDGTQDSHAHL